MDEPTFDLKETPKFDQPPLIETALGVQFAPLAGFQLTHYGLFQASSQKTFAAIEQYPCLPHQIEQRESGTPLPFFNMMPMFFVNNLPRVWYRQPPLDGGEHLVQLQNDRLVVNWRRIPGHNSAPVYPSYRVSKDEFSCFFNTFCQFAEANKLGPVVPDQCEVVYVNEIKTADFDSPAEAFKMVFDSALPYRQPKLLSTGLENQNFNASYWSDRLKGRFFIDGSIMMSPETAELVITLRLTARGAPSGKTAQAVLDWLDLGHYYVVHAFKDVTAKAMHKRWVETK